MAAHAAPAPLLDLVNIQSREMYRERPEPETEEVSFVFPIERGHLTCGAASLASLA